MESLVNELWNYIPKVEHRYQYKTPFERRALYDVDVSFPSGAIMPLLVILVQVSQR